MIQNYGFPGDGDGKFQFLSLLVTTVSRSGDDHRKSKLEQGMNFESEMSQGWCNGMTEWGCREVSSPSLGVHIPKYAACALFPASLILSCCMLLHRFQGRAHSFKSVLSKLSMMDAFYPFWSCLWCNTRLGSNKFWPLLLCCDAIQRWLLLLFWRRFGRSRAVFAAGAIAGEGGRRSRSAERPTASSLPASNDRAHPLDTDVLVRQ